MQQHLRREFSRQKRLGDEVRATMHLRLRAGFEIVDSRDKNHRHFSSVRQRPNFAASTLFSSGKHPELKKINVTSRLRRRRAWFHQREDVLLLLRIVE